MSLRAIRLLAAALLLAPACSADQADVAADIRNGYSVYEGDGFRFAYPSSWEVTERNSLADGESIELTGPRYEDGTSPQVIAGVTHEYGGSLDEALAFKVSLAEDTRDDLEVVSDERLEIEGAEGAALLVMEYSGTVSETGARIRARQSDLVVLVDEPTRDVISVAVGGSVAHHEDGLQEVVDEILASFELT